MALAEPLRSYESTHYTLHTDLSEIEAREALLRLSKTAALYLRRTEGFGGKVEGRLPVYLYRNVEDFERGGGARGSAGVFDGEKLVVLAIRRTDGQVAMATWRVLQHEGFHQFARAVVGRQIPAWASEGLAEYFAEAIFTGDGFVTGLVPQERLARLRKVFREGSCPPLRDFLELSREGWNVEIERKNYDLAWSLVQFFAHGGDAYPDGFGRFMQDVSRGVAPDEAFERNLGPVGGIEKAWRAYWLGLGDDPSADRYARATVAMLTSFLARSHARGDRFRDFDQFAGTPPQDMDFAGSNWLPPTLWRLAVDESRIMRREGAQLRLTGAGGLPAIEAVTPNGARVSGTFSLRDGQVVEVSARVVGR